MEVGYFTRDIDAVIEQVKGISWPTDVPKKEKGLFGKRMRLVSFHIAIARSAARPFLLAAGNCL